MRPWRGVVCDCRPVPSRPFPFFPSTPAKFTAALFGGNYCWIVGRRKEGRGAMGNASSMLTQYDIEEVQEHCSYLSVSQQEIVSLYERFCQLDRSAKGFISEDEFLSIPEFSLNPLSKRLLRMVDGLNFKDFVAFLSTFSAKASLRQKIEFIFKVYDIDGKGKITFKDLLEVLRDLTGSFMSEEQREQVVTEVLEEAGYTRDYAFSLEDFIQIIDHPGLKMEVEVPID
ncbi:Calcineurin subunit B [Zea mays]|uniref:Calcineurin subunit B n=1 Tax=Zea mays TaxID=4577 RepID=A0A1D6QBY9_MAIZE|nr:Calcineurin subunit B [Zea mays]